MIEIINEACHTLHLPSVLNNYQAIADECVKDSLSYTEFLHKLLSQELVDRASRSCATVLKLARFPKLKTLEMFDYDSSSIPKTQIAELSTLKFLEHHDNIILLGPSGTGKTHLAIALGYLATKIRKRVKFITACDLLLQLEIAKQQDKLDMYFAKNINASLLIIDEFGYIKLNQEQSHLFFQVINKRYETGSIIITSNLIFTKWQEVLNNDEALTATVLDRLIHHSHIVNIQGDSYRLKQKRKAGILSA